MVVVAVGAAVEVELEGWVAADAAIAAADPRPHGEDMAVVEGLPDRRASLAHKPLRGQMRAGAAEWFQARTSEAAISKAKDLRRHRGPNPAQRARPRTCRPRRRPSGLAVRRVQTKGDFLILRPKEAPDSEAGNLRPEPRVVKPASLGAQARPGSLGAQAKPGRLGADWVKQAQLPGE